MPRHIRRMLAMSGCICFIMCLSFIDVQMRYRTTTEDIDDLKRTFSPRHWNASARHRTLMQRDDLMSNDVGDDRRYEEEAFSTYLESSERPRRRLPRALIIGVKKGGTRALLEMLRLHPDVVAPGPETHFFDRNYHRGLHWYRSQMPPSTPSQLTMEKTPSYLVTPFAPQRVSNMSRDVRLLVVVRDPVTRALSDYTQAASKRSGDTRSFEDMAFRNASTGLVDPDWPAIRLGQYAKHLERWTKHFPLDHILVVSGEQLVQRPVQELQAVQKFLGLRPLLGPQHFFFNQSKGFPCLRRAPHSAVPRCLGKTKGRNHPTVPEAALQRLRDFFRPFNQKFYRMVGRDFGWS